MTKYIAYCGLDCEKCEARLATLKNDDSLRKKVAKEWSELNSVQITPDMINCTGCRIDGAKTPFCESYCEIRKCASNREYNTCGECSEMSNCEKLAMITRNNSEALNNLKKETLIRIRKFTEDDAEEVSAVVVTTLRISNSKDYPPALLEEIVNNMQPVNILERAGWTHFYVAEDDNRIIGCGAIGPYWGKVDESSLFTIFVLPEYHGKGIGRMIVETLEQDEFFLRAKRVEIPSSITSVNFYRHMGYDYKDGVAEIDDEYIYRLEKFRETD